MELSVKKNCTVLELELKKSAEWRKERDSLIDFKNCNDTKRLRVSVSLLHLSLEHHNGIHVLVEHGLIASAFALLRSQLEAWVRGVWYHRCATDVQVLDFIDGKEPPNFSDLCDAIKKLEGFENGVLGNDKKEIWRNLNDFTHGGSTQFKARNTKDEIISSWLPKHIKNLLSLAAVLSMMTSVEIAIAVDNRELRNNLLFLYQRIYEEAL